MQSKILFLPTIVVLCLAIAVTAQKPVYPQPNNNDQIPFGKKFPKPALSESYLAIGKMNGKKVMDLPSTSFDTVLKKFVRTTPGSSDLQFSSSHFYDNTGTAQTATNTKPAPSGFHLTKDINTATVGSYPTNYAGNAFATFAVLNKVSYFAANDGIHGFELWRSDGTAAGTYLVKDIYPGEQSSDVTGITAANGLVFFSANNPISGVTAWVSDGTEAGTHLLKNINTGLDFSSPNQFINVNGTVFFSASLYGSNNQLWKTDGTDNGTVLVKDLQQSFIGSDIFELTSVNDLTYFIAYTWSSGYQLFRSDGTDGGTYVVKNIGFYNFDVNVPTQLTAYNNKLYFSGNDGSGRKLWESDGTYDGTHYASGFNDVLIQADGISTTSYSPFPVLNNVLFIAGYTFADGDGLYKYNASDGDGIVLVKDLTTGTDVDYIYPGEMRVVNDAIYFKVVSNVGIPHDELWSTKGETGNTELVKQFVPGEITYNFYNINGTLYFVEHDNVYGNELWKTNGTDAGTLRVKDIIPGSGSSYPEDLTFSNGKLLFKATDNNAGTELYSSDGTDAGTMLVKDINNNGEGSNAGFNYKGVGSIGDAVVFNAYTPALGGELYKSDGTTAGTVLLNDIWTGPNWSYPNAFFFKNGVSYFIDDDAIKTAIYKTDGTTAGLQRIIPYINRSIYYVVNFNVTDNGQLFYILGNRNTGGYELWHSDGTDAGTFVLTANLYYNDYVVTIGNMGFFVAGDYTHGYELWKSDGTAAGTKIVKDINAGYNGSYPYSLFAYKKDLYFAAWEGGFNFSLWKSDGTEKGTAKLKDITPAYYNENFVDPAIPVFCVSNNILYFTATDFNTYGAELWKTNGTEAGTKLVKDINPYYSSNPSNLTDVKGTLFFTADDGVHGTELWSTSGTEKNTTMVKDINPYYGSYLFNLCSAGGRLYFINGSNYPKTLWSSDGTAANTNQVNDAVVNGLSDLSHLTPAGNKLFFGGYSSQYGAELYEGDASGTTLTAAKVTIPNIIAEKTNAGFDVHVYPNPSSGMAALQIEGDAKNIAVSITDINGKTIWKSSYANRTQINLPTEKLSAGVYMVTVRNSTDSKIIKLVKQ
ncbi:hypothetical protein BH10BAC3_BH10BAC3_15730 [soil metagenome]